MFPESVFLDTGVSSHIVDAINKAFDQIKKDGDVHTDLCKLMRQNKSDKGWGPWGKHNYSQVYFNLLSPRKNALLTLLEVGIGTNNTDIPSNMGAKGTPGASLRAWRDFFPNATVFGGDVDKRILFTEERIHTFFIDQLDESSIEQAFLSLQAQKFDVIIDDGLHTFAANENLHKLSGDRVRSKGLYIIEDIKQKDVNIQSFSGYLSSINRPSIFFRLPHQRDVFDNCMAIIEY